MKAYSNLKLFEKRKNPDKNPFIGAWDYLLKYKDDPDVYISFTSIDKIGINPMSKYNTPLGIYAYPLKEFVDRYIGGNLNNMFNLETKSIGYFAPFAGTSKYINFLKIKNSAKPNFIEDMYVTYTSADYDKDIKKLKDKYGLSKEYKRIASKITTDLMAGGLTNLLSYGDIRLIIQRHAPTLEYEDMENLAWEISHYINNSKFDTSSLFREVSYNLEILLGIDNLIKDALKNAKEKNPIMSMWNITRLLAERLTKSEKHAATKWNLILSNDLGYSGLADKSGKGYIHSAEPMQAVFFRKNSFDLLHRVENKPKKKQDIIKNKQNIPEFGIGTIFQNKEKDEIKIIKVSNIKHGKKNILGYEVEIFIKKSGKRRNTIYTKDDIENSLLSGQIKII